MRLLSLLTAAGAALGIAVTAVVDAVNAWAWASSVLAAYLVWAATGAMSGFLAWMIIDHRRYWAGDSVPPQRP